MPEESYQQFHWFNGKCISSNLQKPIPYIRYWEKRKEIWGRSHAKDGWSSRLWLNFACGYLMNMLYLRLRGVEINDVTGILNETLRKIYESKMLLDVVGGECVAIVGNEIGCSRFWREGRWRGG